MIEGEVELLDADGNRINPPNAKRLLLCRCGASKVKPFCDSSHYRVDFDPPPAEPSSTEG